MVPERAKMLAGLPYNPADAELTALRARARELLRRFNATPEADAAAARDLLTELLGSFGEGSFIQPPFYCDYGTNFSMGARCFLNFNCVVLDVCPVELGDYVFLGPAVQLLTATHPLDSRLRRIHESGKPVRIGTDVWLGAGVIVCPGVTIGSRSVIGAGSVVTRDIPAGVLAVGNPARVVREIA